MFKLRSNHIYTDQLESQVGDDPNEDKTEKMFENSDDSIQGEENTKMHFLFTPTHNSTMTKKWNPVRLSVTK